MAKRFCDHRSGRVPLREKTLEAVVPLAKFDQRAAALNRRVQASVPECFFDSIVFCRARRGTLLAGSNRHLANPVVRLGRPEPDAAEHAVHR